MDYSVIFDGIYRKDTKKEPLPIPKPGIDRGSSFILWAFE